MAPEGAAGARLPPKPFALGLRGIVLLSIAAAGVVSFALLGLGPDEIFPDADQWPQIGRFFAHAFSPAFDYETASVPASAPPFLWLVWDATERTVVFAATAMSVSVVFGAIFGFFGSTAWWQGEPVGVGSPLISFYRRGLRPALYATTRVVITLMRSVHELMWAVLFLAALGLNDLTAVIAIAIPYGGTLAKIFSEMIDETPRDAALALRESGAGGVQVFLFGLVPQALPDMTAYTLYRFECALRSAAILGFFGLETLGYRIKGSWDEANFGEVWTFLYALAVLVIALDWWSGALRRRLAA